MAADWTRREVVASSFAIGGVMAGDAMFSAAQATAPAGQRSADVTLRINGAEHELPHLDAHTTLLDAA